MLTVEVHATSHIGRVRKGNEDNYLVLNIDASQTWTSEQDSKTFPVESQKIELGDEGIILAVSDGMGGALAGEVASKMAVEGVSKRLLDGDVEKTLGDDDDGPESLLEKLYEATVHANSEIHRQGRSDPQFNGMGATFTAAAVTKHELDVVQVGDSRAYVVRKGEITQVTKDQSLVQQLIDANQIKPEEAETHALKNVILQALGAQSEVFPVPCRVAPCRGDILLLCSDGLSNKLHAADMLGIVNRNEGDLSRACGEMIRLANERGGEDNITIVLSRLDGDDLSEPAGSSVEIEQLIFNDMPEHEDLEITADPI
jgi:serine/threonine protein phosphatase PrpC